MATVKETFLLTALGALCSAICAAALAFLLCPFCTGAVIVRILAHLVMGKSQQDVEGSGKEVGGPKHPHKVVVVVAAFGTDSSKIGALLGSRASGDSR